MAVTGKAGLVSLASTARRAPELWRAATRDGIRPTARRVAARVAAPVAAMAVAPRLLDGDVVDSSDLELIAPSHRPDRGTPLRIAWVCTPPAAGSGGHTTAFRMVEALERAGHTCVLYLYDTSRGDLARHERVIRSHWPSLRAEIRDATGPWEPLDAYVATGWESAHVVAARATFGTERFYFAQDYEPYFYPRGSDYVLAEDTYRFGFTTIAVGRMVAEMLSEGFGVKPAVAEFGCDTAVYSLRNTGVRAAVAMYAKPGFPRRGYTLGMLALGAFHRLHPEVDIHLYGTRTLQPPFPATVHGNLSTEQLAALYNECFAGLALSFTNISLVAEEMLACGAIPVINDDRLARLDLENPFASWARPTPHAMAAALSAAYTSPPVCLSDVAGSVRHGGWDDAKRVTVETIENHVYN